LGDIPMNMLSQITAVILAGGTGTRLRSVVADRPKVIANLGGRPFIAYLLDRLAVHGIRQVVLCTGYLGDQVQNLLGDQYQGMQLLYSREEQPLGTGGAIVQALPMLTSRTVLILNGDSYCETDLRASFEWHQAREARATLVLAHVEQSARFGRVEIGADGRIECFCEKSLTDTGPGWINGGVYWFEREVLSVLPTGRQLSLEREVLGSWVGEGLYGYRDYGRFLDIGVPEDYVRAERFLSEVHKPNTGVII
jgi:NDP-sugar pyrophosphorylase family protein